ncbi:hypothetical protein EON65_58980, partial [archaeon]
MSSQADADTVEMAKAGETAREEKKEPPNLSIEIHQIRSDVENGISNEYDSSSTLVTFWRPEDPSLSPINSRSLRSFSYSPTAPANAPTVLSFTNITVKTRNKPKKVLLDN